MEATSLMWIFTRLIFLSSLIPYQMFDKELTNIGAKINPYTFYTIIDWIQAMGDRYKHFFYLCKKDFSG